MLAISIKRHMLTYFIDILNSALTVRGLFDGENINSAALYALYMSVSLSAGGSFNFMDFLYCQYSLYTILGMLNPAIFLVFISILKTAFN